MRTQVCLATTPILFLLLSAALTLPCPSLAPTSPPGCPDAPGTAWSQG